MNKSVKGQITLLSAIFIMTLALTAGCSAEQPPADLAEAATDSTVADTAAAADAALQLDEEDGEQAAEQMADEGAGQDAETRSGVIAASDEEPLAEEIVVAQADTGEESGAEAEPAVTKPAGPSPYRIGDHYSILSPAQPTSSDPGKIEVTEFFMYSCPHCYNFEAYLEKWDEQKASYVQFVRFPALFNRPARTHARAFFTAETLGILDETHMPFFRELHVNRKAMTSESDLAAFFATHGIDQETFRQAYNSFAVDTQMRKAEALGRRYRITSTPTVIVNGKYVIDGDKISSYEQILQIADYLAQKEASGG